MTLIPASHQDLLTRPLFAHLATIRPDGTPPGQPDVVRLGRLGELADRYQLAMDGPPGDAADRVIFLVEPNAVSFQ